VECILYSKREIVLSHQAFAPAPKPSPACSRHGALSADEGHAKEESRWKVPSESRARSPWPPTTGWSRRCHKLTLRGCLPLEGLAGVMRPPLRPLAIGRSHRFPIRATRLPLEAARHKKVPLIPHQSSPPVHPQAPHYHGRPLMLPLGAVHPPRPRAGKAPLLRTVG
jgi:hypothetical protein